MNPLFTADSIGIIKVLLMRESSGAVKVKSEGLPPGLRHSPGTGLGPPGGRGNGSVRKRRYWPSRALMLICAIVVVLVAIAAIVRTRLAPQIGYVSAPVVRQDLVATVTASGTVNPQDLILVGTQVSGTISELDVDFNSVVKTGQVLARIDPTSLQAQFDAARASLTESRSVALAGAASAVSAQRNVGAARQNAAAARQMLASAQSQVGKTKAALELAKLTLRRDRQLLAQGFISQSQHDADASNAIAARAAYAAATIAVDQARAQFQAQVAAAGASASQAQSASASALANGNAIDVQRADLAEALYNKEHSVITSPVDGTVIQRNISIGQTVAASLQTPTLFTVARDLSKMEVDVALGEPDIGGVRAGDVVDFTVLAYPNRTFHGTVYQVRRNPTTVNNVVTYDTVVYVRNGDGALLPGMTANASIHVAKIQHVLVVPVAALQWTPPASSKPGRPATVSGTSTSPWGTTEASLSRTIVAGRDGRVFELRDGTPARIPVHILLVSNTLAAVAPRGATLEPGSKVVVADTATQMATQQAATRTALGGAQPAQSRPGSSGR